MIFAGFQAKIEGVTGIPYRSQRLVLYEDVDSAEALGKAVVVMDDESKTLSQYGVQEWQCIKVSWWYPGHARVHHYVMTSKLKQGTGGPAIQVENTDPNARAGGEYTDVSQVEKYEISQAEYEKRSGGYDDSNPSVPLVSFVVQIRAELMTTLWT